MLLQLVAFRCLIKNYQFSGYGSVINCSLNAAYVSIFFSFFPFLFRRALNLIKINLIRMKIIENAMHKGKNERDREREYIRLD